MKAFMNTTKVMWLGFGLLVGGLSLMPQAEASTIESFSDKGSDVSYLFNLWTQSLIQNAHPGSGTQGPIQVNSGSGAKASGLVGVDRVSLPLRRSAGEMVFLSSKAPVFHDFIADGRQFVFPENSQGDDLPLPPVGELSHAYTAESSGTNLVETYPGLTFGSQGVAHSIKKAVTTTLALPAKGHLLDDSHPKGVLRKNVDTQFFHRDMNVSDGTGSQFGYTLDGAAFWRKLLGNPDRKQIWPEGASQGAGPNTVVLLGSGLAGVLIWRMKKAQA